MKRRVVITGLGVVSPIGTGKTALWQNLLRGESGAKSLADVTSCSLFGTRTFGSQVVCEASDFDASAAGLPSEYQEMDRFIQFAIVAAQEAMTDANLATFDSTRAGITLATAICGTQTLDKEFTRVTDMGQHPVRSENVDPHLYAAAMGNSAATIIASRYRIQGECLTLSTGCIAGADAVSYACESIAYGDHDIMLAGASEAPITPITIAAFDIIHCLSHRNDDPRQASRPFCKSRDGFVLSEGCGIVVLEELEHALQRNAHIYAEVAGWAVTEHATHMTDMSVEGGDLARAMVGALECANLSPQEIGFINAHGTSTPQNDIRETQAIKSALGSHAYDIPINSTKSMLGHALAAASAVEIVACAMSLEQQQIHPTINQSDPDECCDLDYVPDVARHHPIQWLITNASGFSGLHAAVIMGRSPSGEEVRLA